MTTMVNTPAGPKLDYAKTKELLEEIVAERPDFIYSSPADTGNCYYVHEVARPEGGIGYEAGCGIGVLLDRAGVPLEAIHVYESQAARVLPYWDDDPKTNLLVDTFQSFQDRHAPWSEALEKAVGNVELYIAEAAHTEAEEAGE